MICLDRGLKPCNCKNGTLVVLVGGRLITKRRMGEGEAERSFTQDNGGKPLIKLVNRCGSGRVKLICKNHVVNCVVIPHCFSIYQVKNVV